MALIVADYGFAGLEAAAGVGVVVEGGGIGERGEQVGRIGEAAAGGIGGGEIGE